MLVPVGSLQCTQTRREGGRTNLALYASNTRVYSTPSSSSVTLSAVMALWLGISMAASLRDLT